MVFSTDKRPFIRHIKGLKAPCPGVEYAVEQDFFLKVWVRDVNF